MADKKYVYSFKEAHELKLGKDILGGKGFGLAEMTAAGVNIPAGFTILEMYMAVASPSTLEFVAMISSSQSSCNRSISSFSRISCGPIPAAGLMTP